MDIAFFSVGQWYVLIVILGIILCISESSKRDIYVGSRRLCSGQAFGVGICCVLMSWLAAYRTKLGDTPNYVNIFRRTPVEWTEFKDFISESSEKGFYLLNYILKKCFGYRPHLYLFITTLIIITGVACFFYKYTKSAGLSMYIYILSGCYVSGMNGIRQSIVAAVFAFAIVLVRKNKIAYYIILCILLSFIHNSAILLIPMYWVLNAEAWKKVSYVLLGITAGLYVAYPLFAGVLSRLLQGSNYEVYGNGIQNFTNGGANFIRVLVLALPIVLAYIFREQMEKECNCFGMLLNGALVNFMFILLASIRSWIFARFCMYYNIFSIALLVMCIKVSGKNKKKLLILSVCCYLVFFYFEIRSTVGG